MITRILSQVFGTANDRMISRIRPLVTAINDREPRMQAMSDEQLMALSNEFREKLSRGAHLDDILPDAFAAVREVSRRTLGQRHYDVQLIGGVVLHQGRISEMKTGEGKTLTATLPLYLNALTGKSAHLVTVNDYLARRDAQWMSPIYNGLGLSVSCLQNSMNDIERKRVYAADIVYATNNEVGFDYLRDNMKFRLEDYVQRDLAYAIVDEVDSILIDEARTPLIISGAADESSRLYTDTDRVIKGLNKEVDWTVDEKERSVQLTESGVDKVEAAFRLENLYAIDNLKILHHITQALRAHALYRKDVDYIVHDDEVLIVDEFTGRILVGRRYSDGLHQALEAKEKVKIERETQTLASITLQNLFRMYGKLAGMTGTAQTEAEEFEKIYKLGVVTIPTNRAMIRADKPDFIFLSEQAKFKAITKDIQERYEKKQPVLIGTIAVETSEKLSSELNRAGIPHEVLNAKQHAREAEIVAHAGEPGHITIATNMAGRGTDIKLTPESIEAGGLYILGTERHESRRIDNQLRGRSGRQGDPGESRFYISLDDDLIRRFAGDSLKQQMTSGLVKFLGGAMTEEDVIEDPTVSGVIETAQEKVEKRNFDIRKNLLEYDDVLNQQRIVVYRYRRSVLEGEDKIFELVQDLIGDAIQDIVAAHAHERAITPEIITAIFESIARLANLTPDELEQQEFDRTNIEGLRADLVNYLLERYALFVSAPANLPQEKHGAHRIMVIEAQKWLILETMDTAWKQQMLNLDHLREGIHLRGTFGARTPLIEYKKESYAMFEDMLRGVRAEITHHIFSLDFSRFDARAIEARREHELEHLTMTAPEDSVGSHDHHGHDHHGHNHDHDHDHKPSEPVRRNADKVGRNDTCPCGSGKKYKKCCGINQK